MDRPRPLLAAAVLGFAVALVLLVAGPGPSIGLTAARVVSNGDRTRPVIALTFDDGVSPANCRRILAELVEEHVPATFFPIADAMRLDPAFWRLVAAAGDPVADHSLTHPEMPQLTFAQQEAQIRDARILAESILGRTILRVFRPPYGAYNENTLLAASAVGFPTVLLWDASDRDTAPGGTIPKLLAAAELGRNGSVLLMHCGPNVTPYLVPTIIDYYRGRGFSFVTVPTLLHLSWSPGTTRTLTPAEILDGLSPLPPLASGGPITGPNGYSPPPSTPTPSPSVEPTATAGPTASPSASPGESPAASEAAPAPSPSPGPAAGSTSDSVPAIAIAALALVAVGLLLGAILVARRQRSGPGGS